MNAIGQIAIGRNERGVKWYQNATQSTSFFSNLSLGIITKGKVLFAQDPGTSLYNPYSGIFEHFIHKMTTN